ncbi:MAG: N-acetyltransferase family protein [Chloroflexota bacterium]
MKNTDNNLSPGRRTIRIAEPGDLPAIVGIYNQAIPSFRSTARTVPVTVDERRGWFQEHDADKHPIFVAELDGLVVGWCSLSEYRPGRPALRFTAELSYYVDTKHQRQGVGSKLINHALEISPSLGIRTIVAVLIERNDASRKLLEKLGFQQWGHLPGVLDLNGEECGEFYYGKRVLA